MASDYNKRVISVVDRFKKATDYYAGNRQDLLSLLPSGATKILDVGCGAGETWVHFPGTVYGIEYQESAAAIARKHLAGVLVGDVEELEFPYPRQFFDCAVFGDILEHLYDPWGLLLKIRPYLSAEGHVLISLPNVRYYKILRALIFRADFAYTHAGIMDIDHVRFFARKNIDWMLEQTGFSLCRIERARGGSFKYRLMNSLLRGRLDDFLTKRYLILARVRPDCNGS
jgi:SAM-dependent methyltransferase